MRGTIIYLDVLHKLLMMNESIIYFLFNNYNINVIESHASVFKIQKWINNNII